MNNSIAVKWVDGLEPPLPELSPEEKFFAVAVHYYKTRAEAHYPEGVITAAGRAFGLEKDRIQSVTNSANDYVIRGCQPDPRSKFRPVPSETPSLQLLRKAA